MGYIVENASYEIMIEDINELTDSPKKQAEDDQRSNLSSSVILTRKIICSLNFTDDDLARITSRYVTEHVILS